MEEDLAYILRDKIWEKLIYFSHNLTLYGIFPKNSLGIDHGKN
jgi:hypothetical protein